ncbi:hypothetical protein PUV54_15705 [Hyphococcus flavus]|uniref:Uncharacterized protein n=1 Tax=Hyphococcus flavus TaxID=1866326 RepID=A0AAE9ZJ49_9PROT|nr:hypothetical protein [Hyphococcus flavus]WDI31395.1 hypothetical protein PUV54_15705 [Hyphococcus flavus]
MRFFLLGALLLLLAGCGNSNSEYHDFLIDELSLLSDPQSAKINSQLAEVAQKTGTNVIVLITASEELREFEINRSARRSLSKIGRDYENAGNRAAVVTFFPEQKLIGLDATAETYPKLRGRNSVFNKRLNEAQDKLSTGDPLFTIIEDFSGGLVADFEPKYSIIQSIKENVTGNGFRNEYQSIVEDVAATKFLWFHIWALTPTSAVFEISFSNLGNLTLGLVIFVFVVTLAEWLARGAFKIFVTTGAARSVVFIIFGVLFYWTSLCVMSVFAQGTLLQKFALLSLVDSANEPALEQLNAYSTAWFNTVPWFFAVPMGIFAAVIAFYFGLRFFGALAGADPEIQRVIKANLEKNAPLTLAVWAASVRSVQDSGDLEDAFSGEAPFSTYFSKYVLVVLGSIFRWVLIAIALPSIIVVFFAGSRMIKLVLDYNENRNNLRTWQHQIGVAEQHLARRRKAEKVKSTAAGKAFSGVGDSSYMADTHAELVQWPWVRNGVEQPPLWFSLRLLFDQKLRNRLS